MNDCCKHAKWWPHNWLCLKGLYVVFVVLFYIVLAFAIYTAYQILTYPMLSGKAMWVTLGSTEIQLLGFALFLLTIAKMLKALRKIKKAVAPCCCEKGAKEEKQAKEDKKAVTKEEKSK